MDLSSLKLVKGYPVAPGVIASTARGTGTTR